MENEIEDPKGLYSQAHDYKEENMKTDSVNLTEDESNLIHNFTPELFPVLLMKMDWNKLMSVVEKISKLHDSKFHYDFSQIKQGNWPADNEYMEVITLPMATPIAEVYKKVVEFIKWYNHQTP